MKKYTPKILTVILAVLLMFSFAACENTRTNDLKAKSYSPSGTYYAGDEFTLDAADYFENAKSSTTYASNVGTMTGSVFSMQLASGTTEVSITATEGSENAILAFSITAVVKDGVLSAKVYDGATSGLEGFLFSISDVSALFNNATDNTVYTANIGTLSGKAYSLMPTLAKTTVEITAAENDIEAKLTFVLDVGTYAAFAAENKTRAVEYAKLIKTKYWNSTTQQSKLTPGGGTPYLWPYTEQVAMCNAVLEILDPVADKTDYDIIKQYLIESIEGLRYYRVIQAAGYSDTAFGVLSAGKDSYAMYNSGLNSSAKDSAGANKGGIYFDDNIWVAKELYFAYENLGEIKYLYECLNILNWILGEGYESGTSVEGSFKDIPMNGIYWNWGVKDTINNQIMDDTRTASLNSCSSAPTAMVLFKTATALEKIDASGYSAQIADFRSKGQKIVSFMTKVLRKPDGLYRDKIFLRTNDLGEVYLGPLDEQTLGYNTGCMITAGVELYNVIAQGGKKGIMDLTKATASTANVYFAGIVAVPGQYTFDSNSWFTSFLLDGYIDLYPHENTLPNIERMRSSLDYGWENNKSSDGLVAPGWAQGWSPTASTTNNSENNERQILLQSANAHCYAMLARFYSQRAAAV